MLPRNLTEQGLRKLIDVAQGKVAATTFIHHGTVLNVHTGELLEQNVALADNRVAYVGPSEVMVTGTTNVIDASDLVLVPGYIEPHAHSFQIYNPESLSGYALRRGTTTMLHDNLPFFLNMEPSQLEQFLEKMWEFPVKNFWWCRLDPQVQGGLEEKFDSAYLEWMMNHPLVLQAGEFTDWKRLLDGSKALLHRVWQAKRVNKRIETHNPGSSIDTLNAVAAAGITACHESISGEDVLRRVRLGYYAALRHSSIRPDLPALIRELLASKTLHWDKTYFTTDGSPPFYLEHGFIDYCIQLAIEAGLEPAWAYRMASHHAAVYYRLDSELGAISPGRLADILFLEDLRNPRPIDVMADGKMYVKNGELVESLPKVEWERYGIGPLATMAAGVQPNWFRLPDEVPHVGQATLPVITYINTVITRSSFEEFEVGNGHARLQGHQDVMYAALLHRNGEWVTNGLVRGLGVLDALAATNTLSGDIVVLGTDWHQMALAANRVLQRGGGISVYDAGHEVYHLPLPLFGLMSREPMDTLIRETRTFVELMQHYGYQYDDPIYSLLFLGATHLPSIRMTPRGVFDMKRQEILIAPVQP